MAPDRPNSVAVPERFAPFDLLIDGGFVTRQIS